MVAKKNKETCEFGDFQTPDTLAAQVATTIRQIGITPATILEPTCGKGNLLISAMKAYPYAERIIGADINPSYLSQLRQKLADEDVNTNIDIIQADFFETDWKTWISKLPEPILIIGNPPWVTSSALSAMKSSNIPKKSNFHGRSGLEALTGKSNFDISEWILLQHLTWLQSRNGIVAMLCKTAVARKVLLYAWKNNIKISSARVFRIDAKYHFGVSVDACLFILTFDQTATSLICDIFDNLSDVQPSRQLGYYDGLILSDIHAYHELRHLAGEEKHYAWRSGIKHDSSKLMELVQDDTDTFFNSAGDKVFLEDTLVYPMLKSSDIGNGRTGECRKYMLVTQKFVGEDTSKIRKIAPHTWDYLQKNRLAFARRASSIYRNRPDFSIFGVGEYTFAPWKVAISGFYKKLHFIPIGPDGNKPVVFDDTVYFLSCYVREEAEFLATLLNSEQASQFFHTMIFWESKRPITIEVLKRLSIYNLACALGVEETYRRFVEHAVSVQQPTEATQLRLLERSMPYP